MQVNNTMICGLRIRKQVRKALPVYIGIIVALLFFISKSDLAQQNPTLQTGKNEFFRRVASYKLPLHKRKGDKFPRKIWQSWKVDPLDFDERDSIRARSWVTLNPGHRYEVLTDANSMDYVEQHFGPEGLDRQDVVYVFRTLNATIIKADLLRYLVMYIEGGVYADIDVSAIRPVAKWIPEGVQEKDASLVISVEIDEPNWKDHPILGPKSRSFCQWTFMSKPRHPVMLRLIDNVLHWLEEISQKQGKGIADIELNFDEVLTGTGPSAFTAAVMDEMYHQTGWVQNWDTFHAMHNRTNATLVGDILVLTVDSFAAGQGHSDAGNHDSPRALVRHHYHASLWPSRHPRYSHPAYGMVEECNWKPECVNQWDMDKDNFVNLSQEQKEAAIANHQLSLAGKFEKEEAERKQHEQEEVDRRNEELRTSCASFMATAVLKAHEPVLTPALTPARELFAPPPFAPPPFAPPPFEPPPFEPPPFAPPAFAPPAFAEPQL
ncbi:putative initiation-specific alpha-1,6-mannosyltransferase [Amylocarpus encephaloides]|uniref:Initiation-specific alpha-1,6-mannosyltransferase n=1 Tax=Amylocarpus encephaloides TaxID=45428 RepID=A0A9P8C1F4_9HELO|nr:putative initiation-specific alpha-1,6-mannosyltransferase [Amylocarpus encephaloides]